MIKDTDVEIAKEAIIKLKKISSELLDKQYLKGDSSIGILGGNSGIIMFLFYYAQYSDDVMYSEVGKEYVYQLFDKINAGNVGTTFCNGLSGAIWLLENLVKNNFIEFDIDDSVAQLDEYLAVCMQKDIHSRNYDFLHGAIGYGMYFLERYKNTNSDRYKQEYLKYIYQLINFLEESSIEYNNTIYWECDNNQEPKHINLGLAHGIPSIICFLAKVYNANIEKERIKRILEKSVKFIMRYKTSENISTFPSKVDLHNIDYHNNEDGVSRMAWCYGDLGIAIALYHANQILNNNEIEREYIVLLHKSAQRKSKPVSMVEDTSVCHGSFGLALIFKKFYDRTKIESLNEAYTYWLNEGLGKAVYTDGIAGFKAHRGDGKYEKETDILTGVSGIGLTLISILTKENIDWDECLLLS
ncbi:lanthionine synthetase C family protein [Elizabethkingia ursingii]|uniref:lanthionine synthetase C family protein n=1 Tax=Elizabethkingia ursingii TaxID=1756150 RepID=UPI002012F042|nr:lanthionine synthetase C family protein [Elizabethkingia ursingii]MCL1662914.1 lanthionine synthetase C family protein [Elizabethkingia ursingii]